ncbi:MAG: DEAD/DEAH box helicase [Planctomycetota bacterium]|nr:DEAD/DEAH box helicase [Planctomycetota bacterium]
MLDFGPFLNRIVATREIPARPGHEVPLPQELHPDLIRALDEMKIRLLYAHQAEVFSRVQNRENVLITTGTASGKSLAFLLPVLQAVLEDPSSRAFLVFPTKALGRDQLRGVARFIESLGESRLQAGVYDGDTPPLERNRIRDKANLILTNPDMLNTAFLPNHGRRGFSHIFRNVRFVILDELHIYRGAFGAHVTGLLRRFQRVCRHYGSNPTYLAASATIANPAHLAQTLCNTNFSVVEKDASPASSKTVHFWQPPSDRSVTQEMVEFLPYLINARQRVIAFCRSRKETEVVLKESRDALCAIDGGHDDSRLLAGYRGGYTPEERRQVEQRLLQGKLFGVISTNALELGIDIGSLEIVLQSGFPGTRASFWQQIGRAGRREGESHAVVILARRPMDQYVGLHPDWLIDQEAEHAVVDPDNLLIQLAHIRAAAAELPLSLDDLPVFPDIGEVIPILKEAGELREVYGTFHWCGDPFPSGDFSLRTTDRDRFKVVNRITGTTLTEMDRPQTYREAHPRAIYLHDGFQFMVETLDLTGRVATVVPVEQNYYTQPDVRTQIDILNRQREVAVGRSRALFGDVRVDDSIVGYKMLQFHNHQNLGYEAITGLDLSLKLETEAIWIPVPENILKVLGTQPHDTLRGLVHGLVSMARLRTMAEASDLQGTSFHFCESEGGHTQTAIVLYDTHPGGLGYSQKAHDLIEKILFASMEMILECPCDEGCPACVGDFVLDKILVSWCLQNFFQETPPPNHSRSPKTSAPRPPSPRIAWEEVVDRWEEIVQRIQRAGEQGTQLLSEISEVEVHGRCLSLHVASRGASDWINQDCNRKKLAHTFTHYIQVPEGFSLQARAPETANSSLVSDRLRRRYDDLTRG